MVQSTLFERMYDDNLRYYYNRFEASFVYGKYKKLDECIITLEWIHNMLKNNDL